MACRAVPYQGDQPYVFFSYCHKDAQVVYPIIEQMYLNGFRIWYDDGIHPGSNWPENIAKRLADSAVCVVAVSPASALSHNCRNELNFALECQKPVVGIVLEEFEMPLGMRLQLGSLQYLKRYEFNDDKALWDRLFKAEALSPCRGKCRTWNADEEDCATVRQGDGQSLVLVHSTGKKLYVLNSSLVHLGSDPDQCDVVLSGNDYIGPYHADLIQYSGACFLRDAGTPAGTFVGSRRLELNGRAELENPAHFRLAQDHFHLAWGKLATWLIEQGKVLMLHNIVMDEYLLVTEPVFLLGRSHKWTKGTFSDPKISRVHARISWNSGIPFVEDMNSANGTYVDKQKLDVEEQVALSNGSVIHLGDTDIECMLLSFHE